MSITQLLSAVLLVALCPVWATAFQGYVQTFPGGGAIAWGDGELSVTRSVSLPEGEDGANPALLVRKTASAARKQLLDMALSVRIDARRTVSAYLAEDPQAAADVRGVIHNSPLSRPAMFDAGGEIRVSERLRDKLAELVLPTTIPFQSGIPPRLSTSMEQNMEFEGGRPQEAGVGAAGYTGVVVDARGFRVTPALSPVVYGQDGEGAYGAFLVSRSSAIRHGVAAYATTADPQVLAARVGNRPLVVRALSVFGSWRTDVVVSAPMARMVRGVMQSGPAAEQCRLVIVVDQPLQAETLSEEALDAIDENPEEAGQ